MNTNTNHDLLWLKDLRLRYGEPPMVEAIEALDEKHGIPRPGPRPGFATSWEFMELEKHIMKEASGRKDTQ